MAAFQFIALDKGGRQHKGVLEGDSTRQIRQLVREKGWVPLTVELTHKRTEIRRRFGRLRRGRLSAPDLILFTTQLATLVQAGLPMEEALRAIAEQSEKPAVKHLVFSVRTKVLEGYGFARALAEFPHSFPELYRATVTAGEHAGHLDQVLERLAEYMEMRQRTKQKIGLALLYPAILTVVSVLIVGGMIGFVIPGIVKVFINAGQELPWLTRALMQLSTLVQLLSIPLIIAGVAGSFFLRRSMKNARFKQHAHRLLLELPVLGKILLQMESARFASTLSILTSTGVPLVDAMRIAGAVMKNDCLKQAVLEAAEGVNEGESLKQALTETGYFPPMLLYMIASGEASGELGAMLERASVNQQKTLENKTALAVGLFEPMLLLVMGAVVLVIVLAILLPILNLNQMV